MKKLISLLILVPGLALAQNQITDRQISDDLTVNTDTTNFDNLLSVSEDTVQKALDVLDDTTDTNTQLSDAQVATAATNEGFVTGAHTVDTNTQLSNAQVAAAAISEGFVVGAHTVDTNTQLTDAQVATAAINEGFVTGAHAVVHGDGTNCSLGFYPNGVDANGNVQGCAPDADTSDHGNLVNVTANRHHVPTVNTDAESKCNALESLRGDGSCVVPSSGGSEGTTVSDTAEIDLTLTGLDITADIVTGSLDLLKLDAGVQASLGLADTASQGSHTVDTNTNSATICTGADFLLGDGTCEDSTGIAHGDGGNCTVGFYATGVDALGNAQGCSPDTDSSAQSICTGLESLRGDGTCVVPSSGGSESTTVSDTAEVDLTLTGSDITADIVTGSLDVLKLDAGVQASLALADSASQGAHTVNDGDGIYDGSGTLSGTTQVQTNGNSFVISNGADDLILAIPAGPVLSSPTGSVAVQALASSFNIFGPTTTNSTIDGRDVAADGTAQDSHIADSTIHFLESGISITESQISDLSHTVDTNTNAQTICTGTQYLAGDGTCTLPVSTHALLSGVTANQHHVPTINTNAQTICTGSESLRGDGSCSVPSGGSAPALSKSITVLDPSAGTLGMFYTPVAITITGGVAYRTGGTNVVWNIGHAATRNGTQLDVYTLDKTTTQAGGGTYNSGFNDATIPALSYVWLEIVSVSGSGSQGHVTLTYTED